MINETFIEELKFRKTMMEDGVFLNNRSKFSNSM